MMSIQSQFMDSSAMTNDQVWLSLPESKKLRDDEYQLVEGKWPTNYNEVVLEVDENNEITDNANNIIEIISTVQKTAVQAAQLFILL